MEVRVINHGVDSLTTIVFYSDEKAGLNTASVIVSGKTDAVVFDCQFSLANGHRVLAEIIETGKRLTTIYVSHAHPDHYFGLQPIVEAFPEARVVAVAAVAKVINKSFIDKIEQWEELLGVTNVPRKEIPIEILTENYFELEGHKIEIMTKLMGDMKYNTAVWIPSIKTLYASDVLWNQSHVFTCEVTPEGRKQWIRDIEDLEKLGAEVIIPGHKNPGLSLDTSSYSFTKEYLIATDEELAKTEDEAWFYYAMLRRFPDAGNIVFCPFMNTKVLRGGMPWDWNDDNEDE